MRTLQLMIVLSLGVAATAFGQTVTLKGAVQSKSTKDVVIRLDSGTTITVPVGDFVAEVVGLPSGDGQAGEVSAASLIPTYDARQQCAAEWPTNFQMRAFCEKQQLEALASLRGRAMNTGDRQTIRKECLNQWPSNYHMRNFCEEQQLKALAELGRER